jgi:hypothetical protein
METKGENKMKTQLTMEDLIHLDEYGCLVTCSNADCQQPTYDGKILDKQYPNGVILPKGLTSGNRRKYIDYPGIEEKLLVCNNCRYYVYGAY